MRKHLWAIIGGLWWGALCAQPTGLPTPTPTALSPVPEATMKAHYVLNVMRYVAWPGESFPLPASRSLTLCVLGQDALGTVDALLALEGKRGSQVPQVSVLRAQGVRGLQGCHAVFVAESDAHRMDHIIATLGSLPVLVVTDAPVAAGATVALAIDNRRMVFDIDLTRARASQLQVSSKLMQLARTTR